MLPQKYSAELFIQDQNKELLIMLIRQLNKDFSLTGIDFAFEEKLQIKELVNQLNENIEYLIKNDFQSYLNLLYRIDISESKMKEMNEIEIDKISQKVTSFILIREWQKVWFKNRN
jgi:hypothetical protein